MEIIEHKVWNTFQFPWALLLKEVRIFDWPFTHTECLVCWNQNIYIAIYSYYELSVYFFPQGFYIHRKDYTLGMMTEFLKPTETAV